jgi:hypothetical protein
VGSSWTRDDWRRRAEFVQKVLTTLVDQHSGLEHPPRYNPRMVGTCPLDARPSIVVVCRWADFKLVRNLFRRRAEVPLWLRTEQTGLFRGRQPGKEYKRSLPPLQLVYFRVTETRLIQQALKTTHFVTLGDAGGSCGGNIRYGERSATLGVAVDVGHFCGILTVDHLFPSPKLSPSPSTLKGESSVSGSWGNPMSPGLGQPPSLDDDLWADDDEYLDLDTDTPPEPMALDSPTTATHSPREAEIDGSELWTRLDSSAEAIPPTAHFDWALAWPASATSLSLSLVNTVFPGGHGSEGVTLNTVQESPTAHLASVYMVSGIRGIVHGHIMAVASFLPSPAFSQRTFCSLWTVVLDSKGPRLHLLRLYRILFALTLFSQAVR